MKSTFTVLMAVLLAGCIILSAWALVIDTKAATLAELLAAQEAIEQAIEAAGTKETSPEQTAAPGDFDHTQFAKLAWYEADATDNWRFVNSCSKDVKGGFINLMAELRGNGGTINATPWMAIQAYIDGKNLPVTSLTITAGGVRYRFAPLVWSGSTSNLSLGSLGREMLSLLPQTETVKVKYGNADTGFSRTVTYTVAELQGILGWATGLEAADAWAYCNQEELQESDLSCLVQ
jgi:hypothetical protein